jgi:hypothetical protein
MKILLLALILLSPSVSPFAFAEKVGDNCLYSQEISGDTVVNHFFTLSIGCLVQVTPLNKPELHYREYVFDERGRFLVFNSLPGDYETATGRRNFFFFPRKQPPSFVLGSDGNPVVTLSSGQEVTFNAASARIAAFSGVQFTENPAVTLDDQGGVEIQRFPGILLDTGWKIGGPAYHDALGSSTFRDPAGKTCTVKNEEIFDYKDAIYDEPLFKYQTDKELELYLSRRCPLLDTSSLR